MQCINLEARTMSFDFGSNNINQFKAQSAYKDGSGMGGGGMYTTYFSMHIHPPALTTFLNLFIAMDFCLSFVLIRTLSPLQ